ncbi:MULTISPECIES: outer-membrane lipoprotein carrier protein LolA [unclassified Lentilitoribacter]|uniref:outer-membrane lipoprotein carrier protein LolA n=1 Tax=unclassified Lentilitoribacter TaxID=2647570 RepID=UPI001FCE6EDE|nr:outer membrane lipoprotein carrier protein LolA [Lentilitoribacter sp. Alg239-R112]
MKMTQMNYKALFPRIADPIKLVAYLLLAISLSSITAKADGKIAQNIASHFASVKTMMGEFVQLNPDGNQIAGKFFISRPGKLRFNYEKPSPVRVISDGRNLVVGNQKLKTWSLYPLRTTPLKLLLANKINLKSKDIKSVTETDSLVTIVMGNKTIFGKSTITMMFDPASYELRQWTIKDVQGKETTVLIFNVETGVDFAKSVFRIPYHEMNKDNEG